MLQDQAERGGVLFIFGIGQRVNQHVANLGRRVARPLLQQPVTRLADVSAAWRKELER